MGTDVDHYKYSDVEIRRANVSYAKMVSRDISRFNDEWEWLAKDIVEYSADKPHKIKIKYARDMVHTQLMMYLEIYGCLQDHLVSGFHGINQAFVEPASNSAFV